MKKVLFLVNYDIGLYNFRLELVERLLAEGHKVVISSPYGERIEDLKALGGENCYFFPGGTDSAYFPMRPNDYLKFEIIKWAKAKGLKNFVLGGGYGADDGIFQYKQCLAPHGVVEFYIGKQICRCLIIRNIMNYVR